MQQLLLDGARPENLPLYFNRMVDTKQDILLIHSATGHNVAINHSGIPDQRFNEIPLAKTSPAKPYFAGRYKARNLPRYE